MPNLFLKIDFLINKFFFWQMRKKGKGGGTWAAVYKSHRLAIFSRQTMILFAKGDLFKNTKITDKKVVF